MESMTYYFPGSLSLRKAPHRFPGGTRTIVQFLLTSEKYCLKHRSVRLCRMHYTAVRQCEWCLTVISRRSVLITALMLRHWFVSAVSSSWNQSEGALFPGSFQPRPFPGSLRLPEEDAVTFYVILYWQIRGAARCCRTGSTPSSATKKTA